MSAEAKIAFEKAFTLRSPSNSNSHNNLTSKAAVDNKITEPYHPKTETNAKERDYLDIANIYFDSKQYESAIEYYKNALKVNPYNESSALLFKKDT